MWDLPAGETEAVNIHLCFSSNPPDYFDENSHFTVWNTGVAGPSLPPSFWDSLNRKENKTDSKISASCIVAQMWCELWRVKTDSTSCADWLIGVEEEDIVQTPRIIKKGEII